MKNRYGLLALVALLACMFGCQDMPPMDPAAPPEPAPAQPDSGDPVQPDNQPALPDGAPPQNSPPASSPPPAGDAEDQGGQLPGPSSYFKQPTDQPPTEAESQLRFELNTDDSPSNAANGAKDLNADNGEEIDKSAPAEFGQP